VTEGFRPTWVEVDLEAIRHNARVLKPDGAELMAIVKANATRVSFMKLRFSFSP